MAHAGSLAAGARFTRARLAACCLAALGLTMTLVATGAPGAPPLSAIGERFVLHVPNWSLIAAVLAALAACLAVASSLLPVPRRKNLDDLVLEPPPPPRFSPLALAAMLLLVLAIVALATLLALHGLNHGLDTPPAPSVGVAAAPPIPPPPAARGTMQAGAIDWGVAGALAAVAAAVVAGSLVVLIGNAPWRLFAEWTRRRRARAALSQDLQSIVATGLRDLGEPGDARRAVIACYRRCEAAVARRRRRRYPAETAREFVGEALAALHLPAASVRALLGVFERARFSDLAITKADRDTAAAALGAIQAAMDRKARDGAGG
jgi:uncharacterized protein YjiS (DUF1127 family)